MKVIIIGGGVAGITAAAELAGDAEVTVLESEAALGYHASGRSAAMFEKNYGNDVIRALNRASEVALREAGVLGPRGIMLVARAQDSAQFHADVADMNMEVIDIGRANEMVPILSPGVELAAQIASAEDLDTDLWIQSQARRARATGAEIITGAKVTAIKREMDWVVTTNDRMHRADIIVNASGAWADQVAEMAGVRRIGLQPFRRSMARVPAPDGHDVRTWPMLFGPGESWYAKPDAGSWLISPAEEDPVEPMDAWADDMILAEGVARYQEFVVPEVTRVEANWAGLRTFAPDRTLVIGQDATQANFFWLAGQGGYGFQTSPAAARLTADLIFGRESSLVPEIVARLSPKRFG